MGYSRYDPAGMARAPWNAGRIVGAKKPLKPKQVWKIRFWLERERRVRDRALFDLAIDSKLRGCDLVSIKTGDLTNGPEIKHRAMVVQRKTKKPVQFELMSIARQSLPTGWSNAAVASTNMLFQVASTILATSAPVSMRAS